MSGIDTITRSILVCVPVRVSIFRLAHTIRHSSEKKMKVFYSWCSSGSVTTTATKTTNVFMRWVGSGGGGSHHWHSTNIQIYWLWKCNGNSTQFEFNGRLNVHSARKKSFKRFYCSWLQVNDTCGVVLSYTETSNGFGRKQKRFINPVTSASLHSARTDTLSVGLQEEEDENRNIERTFKL